MWVIIAALASPTIGLSVPITWFSRPPPAFFFSFKKQTTPAVPTKREQSSHLIATTAVTIAGLSPLPTATPLALAASFLPLILRPLHVFRPLSRGHLGGVVL